MAEAFYDELIGAGASWVAVGQGEALAASFGRSLWTAKCIRKCRCTGIGRRLLLDTRIAWTIDAGFCPVTLTA